MALQGAAKGEEGGEEQGKRCEVCKERHAVAATVAGTPVEGSAPPTDGEQQGCRERKQRGRTEYYDECR